MNLGLAGIFIAGDIKEAKHIANALGNGDIALVVNNLEGVDKLSLTAFLPNCRLIGAIQEPKHTAGELLEMV